jgi:hypothetical protein
MSDYNNGQIHGWNGGECPVHPETVVKFWTRDGRSFSEGTAKCLRWSNLSENSDIIAFQVVKQHVEPKVIWVNEYRTTKSGWDSEADAKKYAMDATRIAVKYVEVKDD